MIGQMGYRNTGEAGQDLRRSERAKVWKTPLRSRGRERHLGRTTKHTRPKATGNKPVAFECSFYECPVIRLDIHRCYHFIVYQPLEWREFITKVCRQISPRLYIAVEGGDWNWQRNSQNQVCSILLRSLLS